MPDELTSATEGFLPGRPGGPALGSSPIERIDAHAPLAPPLKNDRLLIYVWQLAADLLVIFAAFSVASWLWSGEFARPQAVTAAELLSLLYLTLALYNGTYSLRALKDWLFASKRMAVALLLGAALLNFVAFYFQSNAQYSRVTFTLGLVLSLVLLTATRVLAVQLSRRLCGPSPLNVLVIDDGGPHISIPHAYHVSAAEMRISPKADDPHALDRLGCCLENMDQAIVSCTPERRAQWARALKAGGVEGHLVNEFVQEIGALGVRRFDRADVIGLTVSTGPLGMRARITKRAFDLVAAAAALLVLVVPLLVVALVIKVADGGPALFVQERVGRGNRLFRIYKFRTMRWERNDITGSQSTLPEDERITRVGRFLRRTSIDELPQLLNVVVGNMSLVGPRPHALGSQAGDKPFWQVDSRYWLRHSLKPGVTGLAQVRGLRGATHSEADLAGRLQADLEYLAGWSLWRDIGIILATLRVLVHDRAY